MVEPHACVCIRGGTVRIYKVGLYHGNETVMARWRRISRDEDLPAHFDMAGWDFILPIVYPYSLGVVFVKVLGFEMCYIWII